MPAIDTKDVPATVRSIGTLRREHLDFMFKTAVLVCLVGLGYKGMIIYNDIKTAEIAVATTANERIQDATRAINAVNQANETLTEVVNQDSTREEIEHNERVDLLVEMKTVFTALTTAIVTAEETMAQLKEEIRLYRKIDEKPCDLSFEELYPEEGQ